MSNNIEVFEYNNPNAKFGFTPNSILNLKEMDNNKQSSIELFAIALYEKGFLQGNSNEINDLLEEHKAMHKEEVQDAYQKGRFNGQTNWGYGNDITAESYYNETFGGYTGVIGVDNISWTNTNKLNNGGNNE